MSASSDFGIRSLSKNVSFRGAGRLSWAFSRWVGSVTV